MGLTKGKFAAVKLLKNTKINKKLSIYSHNHASKTE